MDLTADWLTQVLHERSALTGGNVSAVERSSTDFMATLSSLERINVSYSDDSAGPRPGSLLLKTSGGTSFMLGQLEAGFYQRMLDLDYRAHLPEIYAVEVDPDGQVATILMGEVTGVQAATEWPLPPALPTCERAVRSLAAFHSDWRGHPEAGQVWENQVRAGRYGAARLSQLGEALAERLGDALTAPRRELLLHLCDAAPQQAEQRVASGEQVTLAHGDAHFWNILVPQAPEGEVKLIDWQLWGADLPATDLAYMIALHWFAERRAAYEYDLIASYADAAGRSLNDVWLEYRHAVAGLLPRVALYASVVPAWIWWPHLHRAYAAYDDLNCRELF